MKRFARLYAEIDETNKTNDKIGAMAAYFREAPPEDAAWAVSFLIGRRPKRLVSGPKFVAWAIELSGLPEWLFGECYDAVGDIAETIAAVLPDAATDQEDRPLHWWVEARLLPLAAMEEPIQRQTLIQSWMELERQERYVWNKLITGAFRVGVSQELVVRALSLASGIPAPVLSHRLMGTWAATPGFFQSLIAEDSGDADISQPYPFCLAYPLEGAPVDLGDISEWAAEWKWDGIRAQIIKREGGIYVWSRGEDLMLGRFPEVEEIARNLPDGTVLDGEIMAWSDGKPMRFLALQKRIGRKVLSKKILQEVPVVLIAYDILEFGGRDIRERPLDERRQLLEQIVAEFNSRPQAILEAEFPDHPDTADHRLVEAEPEIPSPLLLSARVEASTWEELAAKREQARGLNVEGLMLKRRDSEYRVGRRKGAWWKWKIEPLSIDAVLIYAQRGSGKRASLYTDYTFGIWRDGKLVSFAKAYSGLTDAEIQQVDRFVRNNTLEKFGPVRTVKPELVMELGFEAIQPSNRHKSGIAVRFPRILRWRHDKGPEQADTFETVQQMLEAYQ